MKNPKYSEEDVAAYKSRFEELKATIPHTFTGFEYDFGPSWAELTPDQRRARLEEIHANGSLKLWLASFAEMFFDEAVSAEVSEFVREKMRARLEDDRLCELLIPKDYGFGTHRVPLEANYLEVYLRPNVEVVSVTDNPIARLRPEGIETADGTLHELDVVILATFGEQGLARAILFDLGQTTLTLTLLYGLAVAHGAKSTTARSAMVRFLSSPPLWALCGSLLLSLFGVHLHAGLRHILTPLHLTTIPLASLVLGLSISVAVTRRTVALALVGVVMRMAGGLLLGLGAAFMLDLTGIERTIVVLIAAMPSAVTAVIFAADTGLDEDLVTSIVALSICVGITTLPWLPPLIRLLE